VRACVRCLLPMRVRAYVRAWCSAEGRSCGSRRLHQHVRVLKSASAAHTPRTHAPPHAHTPPPSPPHTHAQHVDSHARRVPVGHRAPAARKGPGQLHGRHGGGDRPGQGGWPGADGTGARRWGCSVRPHAPTQGTPHHVRAFATCNSRPLATPAVAPDPPPDPPFPTLALVADRGAHCGHRHARHCGIPPHGAWGNEQAGGMCCCPRMRVRVEERRRPRPRPALHPPPDALAASTA